MENAQNLLDAFLADESLKPIIGSLMPHALCSELPVGRTFFQGQDRDKLPQPVDASIRALKTTIWHSKSELSVRLNSPSTTERYANQPGPTASGTPSNPNIP